MLEYAFTQQSESHILNIHLHESNNFRAFGYLPLITTKTVRSASTNWVLSFSSAILLETPFVATNFGMLCSRCVENRMLFSMKSARRRHRRGRRYCCCRRPLILTRPYKCGHISVKLMASFMEIRSRGGELLHTDLQTSWQTHGEAQRFILMRSYYENKLQIEL